ncbi:MAG: septal ring lytic transglycosylase RlpA family protein [Patescibacteria group bacterium]
MKQALVVMIGLATLACLAPTANADIYDPLIHSLFIDEATLSRGYTIISSDKVFYVGVTPDVLTQPSDVVTKQLSREIFDFPAGLAPISDVYEFDLVNKDAFNDDKPVWIKIKPFRQTDWRRRMYFYNGVSQRWEELPTYKADAEFVKAAFHLPYARLVVLTNDDAGNVGQASWYAYKNCLCAASPDYPKGSIVEVTNLDNGSSVNVKINDYGPDRSIFPDRVIDLDKVAFERLGSLRDGILKNVKVRLISLP